MKKIIFLFFVVFILIVIGVFSLKHTKSVPLTVPKKLSEATVVPTNVPTPPVGGDLVITTLQNKSYPGSTLITEQSLPDGTNYHQYVVSYQSDGLKIYGLLTIPTGNKPSNGWPAILFNHGYISPDQYQTAPSSGQYASYVAALASQGFIVFKPDYRGNGNSQGSAQQSYVSAGYIDDDMNALASLKKYKDVNPNKIGVWGHSMGGNITLHDLVIAKDIKAAVIWAGVVGSYSDILQWWQQRIANHSIVGNDLMTSQEIMAIVQQVGDPQKNPGFWNSIDPVNYLQAVTAPVQLDVSTNDPEVPTSFSVSLQNRLQKAGKDVTLYEYPNDDHNLSQNFTPAMQRTISFFNRYLK